MKSNTVTSKVTMGMTGALALMMALAAGCGFEVSQPFAGPGYDQGKGLTSKADGPFVASTTLLALKDGDANQKAFDGHMDKLQAALPKQPGLIGFSLSFAVGSNKDYRTLAVWEDEDAMLAWVTSDEHAAAMQDMADKAESGEVASWSIKKDELPPSWDDAKAHLEKDGQKAY